MNILVVNDDGINAEGLHILVNALAKYGNVYVCAPDRGRSAASHSIDLVNPIEFIELEIPNAVRAYKISSTPVDCVRVFNGALNIEIDVVFSGINNGLNLGTDIIYSGTVAAAREAMIEGYKSVAISCDKNCLNDIKAELDDILAYIFDNDLLSLDYTININYPTSKFKKSKGIKICRQGKKRFKSYFKANSDGLYKTSHEEITYDTDIDTDVYLADKGYITVVPIRVDQTNYDAFNRLKEELSND